MKCILKCRQEIRGHIVSASFFKVYLENAYIPTCRLG